MFTLSPSFVVKMFELYIEIFHFYNSIVNIHACWWLPDPEGCSYMNERPLFVIQTFYRGTAEILTDK